MTWLFTVLVCAVDTDAVAEEPAHVSQLTSPVHSGPLHHHDGGSLDDPCCQWQATAVPSFDVVKVPHAAMLPALVPVVLLLMVALPFTLLRVTVTPDPNAVRRRFEFLAHSLQAQAPPR